MVTMETVLLLQFTREINTGRRRLLAASPHTNWRRRSSNGDDGVGSRYAIIIRRMRVLNTIRVFLRVRHDVSTH